MLEYGYRSRCCFAPIRLGTKTVKKTNTRLKIWICTKCGKRDTDIIPKDQPESQEIKYKPFADDSRY